MKDETALRCVIVWMAFMAGVCVGRVEAQTTKPADDFGAYVQWHIDRWKPGDPGIELPSGTFESRTTVVIAGKKLLKIRSKGTTEAHWRGAKDGVMWVYDGTEDCLLEDVNLRASPVNPAHTGIRIRNLPGVIQSGLEMNRVKVDGTEKWGLQFGIDCDSIGGDGADHNADCTDMTKVDVTWCEQAAYRYTGWNSLDNTQFRCKARFSGVGVLSDRGSVRSLFFGGGGNGILLKTTTNGGYLNFEMTDSEINDQLLVTDGPFINPRWPIPYLVTISGRVTRNPKSPTKEWVRYRFSSGLNLHDIMGVYPEEEVFLNVNQPENQTIRNFANVTVRSIP